MCQATASLVWGCTVKVADLCLLASALPNIEPALLAIDLILARRRQGRLETAGGSNRVAVSAVPAEVWTMIKTELIKEALADECLELFERHEPRPGCDCSLKTADDHSDDGKHEPLLISRYRGSFDVKLVLTSCDVAISDFDDNGGFEDVVGHSEKVRPTFPCPAFRSLRLSLTRRHAQQLVGQLLAKFGLYLVDSTLLSKDETPYHDFDAAWPIAVLPPPSRLIARPSGRSASVEIDHDLNPSHGLVRLSPVALDLPPDARARFACFLSAFPWLETTGGASPRPVGEERCEASARPGSSRSEPGWMLLNVGWSCS